jgi:hypothetical protein
MSHTWPTHKPACQHLLTTLVTMQAQRDVMMVCLFDRNEALMRALILEAAPRIALMGTPETRGCVQQLLDNSCRSIEDCIVVFLTMLSRDCELKKKTMEGIPKQFLHGMSKEKAARFFLYLDRDVLMPWLRDESFTNAAMIDLCKESYLLS